MFPFQAHPPTLRRARGHQLANDMRDASTAQRRFGRKTIPRAARYTELSSEQFKSFSEG